MWQALIGALLGGGEKPGQTSRDAALQGGFTPNMLMGGEQKLTGNSDPKAAQEGADLQPAGVDWDAFAGLAKQLSSQRNPNQEMRKQQMMQQLQNDPFQALLGM